MKYFTLLFLIVLIFSGCSQNEEITSQDLQDYKIQSTNILEFEKILQKKGFTKDTSSSNKLGKNKLGDNGIFTYSLFRKGKTNFILFQFDGIRGDRAKEVFVDFDRTQSKQPIYIYSDGLEPSTDQYHFKIKNTLDNQWIGIFFESKNENEIAHGELALKYHEFIWRSNY